MGIGGEGAFRHWEVEGWRWRLLVEMPGCRDEMEDWEVRRFGGTGRGVQGSRVDEVVDTLKEWGCGVKYIFTFFTP